MYHFAMVLHSVYAMQSKCYIRSGSPL